LGTRNTDGCSWQKIIVDVGDPGLFQTQEGVEFAILDGVFAY